MHNPIAKNFQTERDKTTLIIRFVNRAKRYAWRDSQQVLMRTTVKINQQLAACVLSGNQTRSTHGGIKPDISGSILGIRVEV